MRLTGFEFRNETETSADLFFYGDIVSDWWGAWQDEDQYPDAIRNFLSEHENKSLNVYVNSGGGSVFAGIAIYNMLKRHAAKNTVKVFVDGLAGSIASLLPFAGSEPPEIPANAYLFLHNPSCPLAGNAAEHRKMADELDKIRDGILNTYAEHLQEGVTKDQVAALMDAETWLNGEEAAKYFAVKPAAAKEYAAALGEYLVSANCKNIPEVFAAAERQRKKEASAAEKQQETEKKLIDNANKNKIRALVVQGLTKGAEE